MNCCRYGGDLYPVFECSRYYQYDDSPRIGSCREKEKGPLE